MKDRERVRLNMGGGEVREQMRGGEISHPGMTGLLYSCGSESDCVGIRDSMCYTEFM